MSARFKGLHRVVLVGLSLFVTACASNAPLDTLEPEGRAAREIDNLLNPVLVVAGIVFVLVNFGVVFIALKYRRKSDDDFPEQIHGNTALELGWTIAPAVVLAVVAVFTVNTLWNVAVVPEEAELEICVTGQQWWWSYEYDLDGDCTDPDSVPEIVTSGEIFIPAGEPVALKIRSNDVIHSFWIPKLHGKKDAVPGRVHDWWFQADQPGRFLGQCTEFCGLSHSRMRMQAVALEPSEFDQWIVDQQKPAEEPTTAGALRGLDIVAAQCTSCHQIDGVNGHDCIPGETCYGTTQPYSGAAQVSGNAPNLTHLMSRCSFAGAIFDLYEDNNFDGDPDCGDPNAVNRAQLEAWIRDPQAEKPMAPDPSRDNEFGRGMPTLPLTEDQIDDVVTYLTTLK